MEVIIWSTGEKYEKSNKSEKPLLDSKNDIIMNIPYSGEYNLKKDDKINEQKRDEIMERAMISQTYQNPFLHKKFTDVLSDQEKYLIPQNSLVESEPPSQLK